jgi:hypothetical protein
MSTGRAEEDGKVAHVLYNRPSTAAGFGAPAALEQVADHANFSHLRVLEDPQGGLLAYWQDSDGITNEVYASRLDPATLTWSPSFALTDDNPRAPDNPLPAGADIPFAPSAAIDSNGLYQVVYEQVAAPGNNNPGPGPQDQPVGNPVSAGVGTSSFRLLPELAFSREMFFVNRNPAPQGSPLVENTAASGSQVVAQAQVVNRGAAGDQVLLQYFDGLPGSGTETLVGSQTITLTPGQSYDISHAFTILPGTETYAIRASAANGQEVTGPTGHVTSATLIGMADVTVTNVSLSDPTPHGGETVMVTAAIDNLSDQLVGTFDAAFYQGDPNFAPQPGTLLATQTVSGLAPFGRIKVSFPWTVPAGGGDFELTVRADSGQVLQEATRGNNDGHALVSVHSDAAVVPVPDGPPAVSATLLNYSGVHNVTVTAAVTNLGRVDLSNVPVQLLWAVDGGPFQPAGSATVPSLPAGTSLPVTFTADGWAGQNHYRVVVDPSGTLPDADRSDNVAETVLTLEGLPDLRVGPLALLPSAQGLTLGAEIDNKGIAGAQAVSVEVFLVPKDFGISAGHVAIDGKLVGQTVLQQIDPLTSAVLTIPLTVRSAAGMQLCVVLDRLDKILMIDHTQNAGCLSVPRPTITGLGQTTAVEGAAGFTLTVAGSNFSPATTILWNGTPLPTAFVSPSQLQAAVPAALVADEGNAAVTISDPGVPGLGAQTFSIAEHNPVVSAALHTDTSLLHAALTGTFTDSAAEPHKLVVSWGDGTSSSLDLGFSRGGPFHLMHKYNGITKRHRQVTVVVVDDEGTLSNVLVLNIGPNPGKPAGRRR